MTALLCIGITSCVATAKPRVAFELQADSLRIRVDDQPLATYVYRDPEILRPYFKDICAPGGIQVTRHHPPREGSDPADHATMHPGLWLAFGDLGGADFWRNKATVEHGGFVATPHAEGDMGTFTVRNRYMAQGIAVCEETCTYTFRVRPAGCLILWDSVFQPERPGLYFGDQEEMGLGVRVATPIMVRQQGNQRPGRILDDRGRRNEKGIWGEQAAWCDYSGWVGDAFAGIMVMSDPRNTAACRWHIRDYGLMVANPFAQSAFKKGIASKTELAPGQPFRLRFGILVHATRSEDSFDAATAYEDYRKAGAEPATTGSWQVNAPIVTYWCGPALTDAVAQQMAEGGFNLVWCGNEKELDVAHRHGLRGQLTDGLLTPASLDDPKRREELDALVARVSRHPALYSYFLTDEPSASQFPALGKLVAYLRQRDPLHLAYINLFPTYATNEQLGTKGDVVTAYREHLRLYTEQVKPTLISYDHYQFRLKSDSDQYFLNLAMIRRAAQEANVPFLNIVQACTWAPDVMRVPNADELRYLVYSTLAYGARGISYYVYACANHRGSIVSLDGTPGPLYHALKSYNREFAAIARELQPLHSLGVYHTSMREPGCEPLPADAVFHLDSSLSSASPRGFLLGFFGADAKPTHVVVVNLDYTGQGSTSLVGPGELGLFDAADAQWTSAKRTAVELTLPPGGGKLVRVAQ